MTPRTVLFCAAAMFAGALASAHELRPAYLDLLETSPGEFAVLWKTPMRGDMQLSLTPEFSGEAAASSSVTTRTRAGAAIQEWTLRAPSLRGQTVRIRGLESTMTDAVVRIAFADGREWTHLLTPRAPGVVVPEFPESIETKPRPNTPIFPFFAALAGWGMVCIAAAATPARRGGPKQRGTVCAAYAMGITGAFFMLREVVNWGAVN